jgi:ribonucleoside-diphosphate reductase alpha chain
MANKITHQSLDKKIFLTPNQEKVIKDKYLRNAGSVEEWLMGVAHNIALAELIFHPKANEWKIFEGVSHDIAQKAEDSGAKIGDIILFHKNIHEANQRDANFLKFVSNLEAVYENIDEARDVVNSWQNKFYDIMSSMDFLPNSPTLMNAGRELQQLSACYVLPVPDSMEGISKAVTAQGLIQKSGGGTGFNFGWLRPKGDLVKKTKGVASGALSFMQIFDKMTDVVKQGGTRRGANMGILPYWHPEIKDFISMKAKPGVMENFNISVALDSKFMKAVENNEDYELLNPRTKEVVGKLNANEVFNQIVECAWKTGDPGVIFVDKINNSMSNPTPELGRIECTNPCGEQPLFSWEPCNLGSLNLAHFVKGPAGRGTIDYEHLGESINTAIRFLDNVIDVNNYPLEEIEEMAKSNRRIGMGVMGWAETLVKLGIAYDSEEACKTAEELMEFINTTAGKASEDIAKERGVFPNWKNSVYDPSGKHFKGTVSTPRNCARTTIAPTGTIAITAGLQGSGIEPFFGISYTRYNAKALDALKKGNTPDASDVFFEVNPTFREIAQQYKFFGLKEEDLWSKIDKNHKAVRGIPEIPDHIQQLFPTAHDVSVEWHIKMQSSFQKNVDNGVSKTVNLKANASLDDVRKSFFMAYNTYCKGITIYRDGCKSQQVLNLGGQQKAENSRKPFAVSSEYYQINTGYGPLHMHINYDDKGPYQVFTNIPPLGTEISGLTSLVGILLSKYLVNGGDPVQILKHLNSVKGDRPIGFGENRVNSIAHAISIALRNHLKRNKKITKADVEKEKLELWEATRALYCPKCYSSNVSYQSGCSGPTCHDCGHSECS